MEEKEKKKTVYRKEFVREFAKRTGLKICEAEDQVEGLLYLIAKYLFRDGVNLTLASFGSFKHCVRKGQCVRHPGTGELIYRPDSHYVKFTPADWLTELRSAEEFDYYCEGSKEEEQ